MKLDIVSKHLGLNSLPKIIGQGQESVVYKLDEERILRIYFHSDFEREQTRKQFYDTLKNFELSFQIPELYDLDKIGKVLFSIERLLPGFTIRKRNYKNLSKNQKILLVENYLKIPEELKNIVLDEQDYGDMMRSRDSNCKSDSWTGFIKKRVQQAFRESQSTLHPDIKSLSMCYEKFISEISILPVNPTKSLVHGDLFFENILVNNDLNVVAVIDFSGLSVVGDYYLDIAGVYNYLAYFDFVSRDDLAILKKYKESKYSEHENMLKIIDLYNVFMAFVFIKDTRYDDPLTYNKSVAILNNYI